MVSRSTITVGRLVPVGGLLVAALALLLPGTARAETPDSAIREAVRAKLDIAVANWIDEQVRGSENTAGNKTKRGHSSRYYRPVDAETYRVGAHIESAIGDTKTTERYELELRREDGKRAFEVADHLLKDTFSGLHRDSGGRCYPFEKFFFDREGLRMQATNGTVCETWHRGRIAEFGVHSGDMSYEYEPPRHAARLHMTPDIHGIFEIIKEEHAWEYEFEPAAFLFGCDPDSCDELLSGHFEGLQRRAPSEEYLGSEYEIEPGADNLWIQPLLRREAKDRLTAPFAHFREPYREGHKVWKVFIVREVAPFTWPGLEEGQFGFSDALPGSGIQLVYNNWAGFEVVFNVWPRHTYEPDRLFGTIYGYYTEETLNRSSPYDLERREDESARWHQVYSVKGEVDLGLVDKELLAADLVFGIELKQSLRTLPFSIQGIPQREFGGNKKSRTLIVNAVQLDGEELTWTKTGQLSGIVILPEKMPAGTRLDIRMDFETRALKRWTNSFIEVSRFGWMPFVRLAGLIGEFELTIRALDDYKVLGVGHKISEEREGKVVVTRWRADSPVAFPSISFGRYREDDVGKDFIPAAKLDGSTIPVTVHVDKVSFSEWDIKPSALRPIARQAANAINLYREISGLDYPYGELNLVNDPMGFLYGQGSSSLIFLGSGVFRGEGFLASLPGMRNSTSIAKFSKSLVAHETGHQWWGSVVCHANDRNSWFEEALAEYFSALYLEAIYGRKAYDGQVAEWRRTILDTELKASVQNATSLWVGEKSSGDPYRAAVFNKGAYVFHMLREIYGDEKFFDFLKRFSRELAETGEVVTLDLQRVAEKGLGGVDEKERPYDADLSWFFDQWIRSVGVPQFSFHYDVFLTEDDFYNIKGRIRQRILVGSKRDPRPIEGQYFRGWVDITMRDKSGQRYRRNQPLLVEGPETLFWIKTGYEPIKVMLNENNKMLAHDVLVNRDW